ncbi:MAG: protein kinase [Oligosphaeraceae bacterium]
MRFQCPQCHAVLELEDGQPGELVQCDQCLTAVTYPSSPTAPGAILGEFVIVRELGQGGMGTVYLAHQLTLDRDVALKVITPSADTSAADIDSFIREARAAALINHPNIVQAYTVNCDSNLWYFAMEYIDGPTVKDLLEQRHQLSPQETLDIAAEIVPGLQYAFAERQMLHRDIKPDNIMLNSAGHAKLADLGLACQATGSTPGEDEITGTPQYLAPELLLGFPADARSDIYSLGATLYHIVTGSAPYDAPTVDELVMKHLTDPLTPVLQRRPDTPPPLAVLIEAMLAKRPAQRYQSYDELAADIARVQQGLMPAKPLCAEAQIPIDPDSPNPLDLPGDDHASPDASAPHGKKTLRRSKSAAPNAASSQPAPNAETDGDGDAPADDTAEPNPKPSRAKAIAAIAAVAALVLLAAAGAAAFLLLKGKPQPTAPSETASVAPAADTDGDTTAAAAETPQTTNPDTPTLAQLAELVAQDSDQAFDRAAVLLAKAEPAAHAEAYHTLAPLAEKRLQAARQPLLDEENATWTNTVDRLRNERHEKERQEAEAAERRRKEDEERKRQEEQEQKERERQEAIANARQDKLQKMLDFTHDDKFLSATLELQSSFDGETDDLKEWRTAWLAILAQADDVDKLLAPFSPTRNDGVTIPGFVFHKVRPNAASDDENYTTVNLKVLAISDGKVSLAASYDDLLRALPSIQRNRIRRQLDGDENALRNASLQLDVPLDLLLPAQQLALAQTAAKRRQTADADAIPALLAARLLVTGNFPAAIAAAPAFQTFRDATADLEDRQREVARLNTDTLAQRHADNLRRLLALAKPNDRLAGLLIANTLRRYLADLGPDFAKNHEDCQQAIAEANALIRQF